MNAVSVQQGTASYRQELWELTLDSVTSKMAGQGFTSPLLCLRPDFLGAGRGNSRVSIFSEFLKLSGLSPSVMENSVSEDKFQYEEVDTEHLQEAAISCTPTDANACGDEVEMENSSASNPSRQLHQVFKHDSAGKPSRAIQYKLNDKTLLLFKSLTNLEISFRTEVYKPKECRLNVDPNIFYCKNLFLKDRKGRFFLLICHEDQDVDLKKLRKNLNAYRNFNFATAADMEDLLGVEPGGVTPFALMREQSAEVTMVICKSLLREGSTLMFHPLDSSLATEVTMTDLLRFLKHFNHPVFVVKSN